MSYKIETDVRFLLQFFLKVLEKVFFFKKRLTCVVCKSGVEVFSIVFLNICTAC